MCYVSVQLSAISFQPDSRFHVVWSAPGVGTPQVPEHGTVVCKAQSAWLNAYCVMLSTGQDRTVRLFRPLTPLRSVRDDMVVQDARFLRSERPEDKAKERFENPPKLIP